MTTPDALVTVRGGVADVTVHTPGIVVEVRDYDIDGADDSSSWTDEDGEDCVRHFEGTTSPAVQQPHTADSGEELRLRLQLFANAVRDEPDAEPITPEHIRHWARYAARGASSRFAWWLKRVADALEQLNHAEPPNATPGD